MALKATKAEVWAVSIDDRAGGIGDKLEPLAKAGANFEMVFARRTPEHPGKGMLFVTPVKGAKVTRAAREAGMGIPPTIYSVRIEGADRPGLGAKVARALGDAGLSFRGISGIAIGRRFVSYVACDSAEDQAKAIAALKKLK
jgi:predicted amino acid-binding ACT domain protein